MNGDLEHGLRFNIKFRYTTGPAPNGRMGERDITECIVTVESGEEVPEAQLNGKAIRNPDDRPDREVARKVSLTRAVSGMSMRDDRRRVWQAYFGRKRRPADA